MVAVAVILFISLVIWQNFVIHMETFQIPTNSENEYPNHILTYI